MCVWWYEGEWRRDVQHVPLPQPVGRMMGGPLVKRVVFEFSESDLDDGLSVAIDCALTDGDRYVVEDVRASDGRARAQIAYDLERFYVDFHAKSGRLPAPRDVVEFVRGEASR